MRIRIFAVLISVLFGLNVFGNFVSAEGTCPGTQVYCGIRTGCIEPTSKINAPCGTGGRQYSDRCGSCGCPVGTTSCTDTSRCIPIVSCDVAGTTFSACPVGSSGSCETPYALRSPSAGQRGNYISVVGSSNPNITAAGGTTVPPEGSLYYNTGSRRLRVKTGPTNTDADWTELTPGATYGAGRNIIDPIPTVAGVPTITVKGDPDFDKLTINHATAPANGDLGFTGDMYLNSGKAIRVDSGTETSLKVGNYNASAPAGSNFHLRVNAPAGSISELVLDQGGIDKWALSARTGGSNFELWRANAAGGWVDAPLTVSNSSGEVAITHDLTVYGNLQAETNLDVAGNVGVQGLTRATGTVTIGANSMDTPQARLSDYLRVVNMDNDSGNNNPTTQYAIRVKDEDNTDWFSVGRQGGFSDSGVWPADIIHVATPGIMDVGRLNSTGYVVSGDRLIGSKLIIGPNPSSSSSTGSGRVFDLLGNSFFGGTLQIGFGAGGAGGDLSVANDLTVTGNATIGTGGSTTRVNGVLDTRAGALFVSSTTPRSGIVNNGDGGVIQIGTSGPGRLRIDNDDINVDGGSTVASTLHLQRYMGGVEAHGTLKVDNTITAGSGTGHMLTNSAGELKTNAFANEDWNVSATDPLGYLVLAAGSGVPCRSVCQNHGLLCHDVYSLNGVTQYGCLSTASVSRYCWCGA